MHEISYKQSVLLNFLLVDIMRFHISELGLIAGFLVRCVGNNDLKVSGAKFHKQCWSHFIMEFICWFWILYQNRINMIFLVHFERIKFCFWILKINFPAIFISGSSIPSFPTVIKLLHSFGGRFLLQGPRRIEVVVNSDFDHMKFVIYLESL